MLYVSVKNKIKFKIKQYVNPIIRYALRNALIWP